MTTPILLDIGAARQIAQRHVGLRNELETCWQPLEGAFYLINGTHGDYFDFAVIDRRHMGVGGTEYVAVNRCTGNIVQGMSGE